MVFLKKSYNDCMFERRLGCVYRLLMVVFGRQGLPTCYCNSLYFRIGYYKTAGSF